MNPLNRLGQRVAQAQDELLDQGDILSRARTRFLTPPAPRPRRRRLLLAGGLAGATAMGALLFILVRPSSPPEFYIGNNDTRGELGQWITARSGESVPLRFSDGSVLNLQPRSGARVRSLNKRGATLLLERGEAEVYVVPRVDNRWSVDAGPFQVQVKGTHFDVAWDPTAEIFDMNLRKGRVTVRGPVLKERHFTAGEAVRVWVDQGRMEIKTKGRQPVEVPVVHQAPGFRERALTRGLGVEHTSAEDQHNEAFPSGRNPQVGTAPSSLLSGRAAVGVNAANPDRTPEPQSSRGQKNSNQSASKPSAQNSGEGALSAMMIQPADLVDEPHPLADREDILAPREQVNVVRAKQTTDSPTAITPPLSDQASRSSSESPTVGKKTPGKSVKQGTEKPAVTQKLTDQAAPKSASPSSPSPKKRDQRSPYDLASEGRYQEALEVAKASWSKILSQAPQDRLLLIGDTARLAGDGLRARDALKSVRRRFPQTLEAQTAAYFLGRINFDQLKNYSEAARWFQLYLQEAPAGGLNHEALGRLMEARHRARDLEGARQAAWTYLDRYKKGPYTDIARALIRQGMDKTPLPQERAP